MLKKHPQSIHDLKKNISHALIPKEENEYKYMYICVYIHITRKSSFQCFEFHHVYIIVFCDILVIWVFRLLLFQFFMFHILWSRRMGRSPFSLLRGSSCVSEAPPVERRPNRDEDVAASENWPAITSSYAQRGQAKWLKNYETNLTQNSNARWDVR